MIGLKADISKARKLLKEAAPTVNPQDMSGAMAFQEEEKRESKVDLDSSLKAGLTVIERNIYDKNKVLVEALKKHCKGDTKRMSKYVHQFVKCPHFWNWDQALFRLEVGDEPNIHQLMTLVELEEENELKQVQSCFKFEGKSIKSVYRIQN